MLRIMKGRFLELWDWLQKPVGQRLLVHEQAAVSERLSANFGIQGLEVGWWGDLGQFVADAQVRQHHWVSPIFWQGVDLMSWPRALGVRSDSADVLVLPHTLELTDDPHAMLREAHRILVGDGTLIILAFNPHSLWGLQRGIWRGRFPPGLARFLSPAQIREWFKLLGIDLVEQRPYCFGAPFGGQRWQDWWSRKEQAHTRWPSWLAGAYLLMGRKRVYSTVTLRGLGKKRHRRRLAGSIVEPSTNQRG
ncbi:MAG: hypothetical protein HKM24_07830 [Gammaproteobacteria bacterium]|nr:hypothetical protein [Gammaproteobacteria bacterium]